MSETYEIYTPNGLALDVEKDTNKILFKENVKPTGKYTQEYSKALFEAHNIKQNSPYKDYKPQYLDPEFHTGEKSTLLEFKEWQSSFKEFESLCEKADSKAVIYDAKNIISLWDNYKKINKDILFNITEQYVDFRIKKIIILWYYKDGKNTIQEYKIDNTYSWLDIGMFAKYKRKMICYDIQKYKELQEKRGY